MPADRISGAATWSETAATQSKETEMVDTTIELFPRELDSRSADGIEVTLLWSTRTNELSVAVSDTRTGEAFTLPAAPATALDVFHHPYAYAGDLAA
jgi:hypothetical protein